MILSREGRGNSMGMLKYTGRDISDEEINLEFADGDWRIGDEVDDDDDEIYEEGEPEICEQDNEADLFNEEDI